MTHLNNVHNDRRHHACSIYSLYTCEIGKQYRYMSLLVVVMNRKHYKFKPNSFYYFFNQFYVVIWPVALKCSHFAFLSSACYWIWGPQNLVFLSLSLHNDWMNKRFLCIWRYFFHLNSMLLKYLSIF